MIKYLQTNRFRKQYQRLHPVQQKIVKTQLKHLVVEPTTGIPKKGKLSDTRVIKFKIKQQLVLLAYQFNPDEQIITLLSLGSHENFYRDLEH